MNDAASLLNLAFRDLYSACGRIKTALGYILTFKTCHYDPDKPTGVLANANHEIGKAYKDVSELCRLILKGSISLSEVEHRIKNTLSVIGRALREL